MARGTDRGHPVNGARLSARDASATPALARLAHRLTDWRRFGRPLIAWTLGAFIPVFAAPLAQVTILEGEAQVLRVDGKFALLAGGAIHANDILRVAPGSGFVRVEWTDGRAMSLGPSTHVLVSPQRLAERGAGTVYVLQGQVKINSGGPGTDTQVLTPFFNAAPLLGVVVMAIDPTQAEVFAESGDVSLQLDGTRRESLPSGTFARIRHDGKPVLANRPAANFIQALPRVFLDSLPQRADAASLAKASAPKRLGPVTYADLQPWLNAAPALRRAYLPHWRPLARDASFRAGLLSEMPLHPEWGPVLAPPKPRDAVQTPRANAQGAAP